MPSAYPAGLDSLSTAHADGVHEVILAATDNNEADAINKIEAELGITPSAGYADVSSRLDQVEQVVYNDISSTTYTLVAADATRCVNMNNASACTLTIPADASVLFPVGTTILIRQGGAGVITVAAVGGVTLQSRGSVFKTAGVYAYATLIKRLANVWDLTGDITA